MYFTKKFNFRVPQSYLSTLEHCCCLKNAFARSMCQIRDLFPGWVSKSVFMYGLMCSVLKNVFCPETKVHALRQCVLSSDTSPHDTPQTKKNNKKNTNLNLIGGNVDGIGSFWQWCLLFIDKGNINYFWHSEILLTFHLNKRNNGLI